MMMLRGFVDESGKDEKSAYLILGGYVLPADRWMTFSEDWSRVLNAAPKASYYHANEAEGRTGAFEGVAREFVRMKTLDLLAVIEKHEPVGLLSWMKYDDWQILQPRVRPGFDDAFYPLFDWIIKTLFVHQASSGIFECSTDFVFDDHTDDNLKANLVKIHGSIRAGVKTEPKLYKMLGSSPTFQDDQKVLPLQAADLLVWHKRRQLNFPQEKREIYKKLADTIHFSRHLDGDSLRNFL